MQKSSLYTTLGLCALITAASIYGCKKVNGIDNNTVIETPYSLYFTDSAGNLFNSNDGKTLKNVFKPDGLPSRALCTSGNNVLWCKNNIYYSTNNGFNFNHAYDSLQTRPQIAVNNLPIDLNHSMIINVPGSIDFVYATSDEPHNPPLSSNYLGVAYSNNHGAPGSWSPDNYYDTDHFGPVPLMMTSFTLMPNGKLMALGLGNVTVGGTDTMMRNFYNENPLDYASPWHEVMSSPTTRTQLPPDLVSTTELGMFALGHYNNRMIAIDQKGLYGAWYSDDEGENWKQFTGLPNRIPLLCINSPFDQVSLIGTDSAGLYMYSSNTSSWTRNNNGLGINLVVRGIAAKENVYKNGTHKRFIYLATNKGIYQSVDMGINWILTIPGNYVSIY